MRQKVVTGPLQKSSLQNTFLKEPFFPHRNYPHAQILEQQTSGKFPMKIINQHRNAGFSLIEVLVSTVLLSIVAVGAFSSMSLARLMREQDRKLES